MRSRPNPAESPSPEGDGFGQHKHARPAEAGFRSRPDRRLSAAALRRFRSLRDLRRLRLKARGFTHPRGGTLSHNGNRRLDGLTGSGAAAIPAKGELPDPRWELPLLWTRRRAHIAVDRGTGPQFPQSGFPYLIPKSSFFNSPRRS